MSCRSAAATSHFLAPASRRDTIDHDLDPPVPCLFPSWRSAEMENVKSGAKSDDLARNP